jgi:cytochrome c biogenesis protein ResB
MLIVALLAGTIIMGLTGLDGVTSSWSFVLLYLLTILSLGALIVRRMITFRAKDISFYLNHIGLWIILISMGLGAADLERYLMRVYEGEVEWRGTNGKKEVIELPIAIELNDFLMEVYPPNLSVINRHTGMIQPENKPDFFVIDSQKPNGRLAEWDIRLEVYIHHAVRNSDSTYHEIQMPGSSPAAKITAINRNTNEAHSGGVCAGNSAQLYMTLALDSNYCVAMMRPSPKRFASDITVYHREKEAEQALLEVNKPFRTDAWTIYQYSYDETAGNLSKYSVLELVHDPWLPLTYAGIVLLALGMGGMLIRNPSTNR